MILKKFLKFGKSSLDDSYKKNSYKKSVYHDYQVSGVDLHRVNLSYAQHGFSNNFRLSDYAKLIMHNYIIYAQVPFYNSTLTIVSTKFEEHPIK